MTSVLEAWRLEINFKLIKSHFLFPTCIPTSFLSLKCTWEEFCIWVFEQFCAFCPSKAWTNTATIDMLGWEAGNLRGFTHRQRTYKQLKSAENGRDSLALLSGQLWNPMKTRDTSRLSRLCFYSQGCQGFAHWVSLIPWRQFYFLEKISDI